MGCRKSNSAVFVDRPGGHDRRCIGGNDRPEIATLSARDIVAGIEAGRWAACDIASTVLAGIARDKHNTFISSHNGPGPIVLCRWCGGYKANTNPAGCPGFRSR